MVVFFYFSLIRALSFVSDVENMLPLWLLLFTVRFFLCCSFIQIITSYFAAKLTSGARFDCSCQKSMCKKWHSLARTVTFIRHILAVCVSINSLFLPFDSLFFALRRALICSSVHWFFFCSRCLLFVVIENMYCEFYDF